MTPQTPADGLLMNGSGGSWTPVRKNTKKPSPPPPCPCSQPLAMRRTALMCAAWLCRTPGPVVQFPTSVVVSALQPSLSWARLRVKAAIAGSGAEAKGGGGGGGRKKGCAGGGGGVVRAP